MICSNSPPHAGGYGGGSYGGGGQGGGQSGYQSGGGGYGGGGGQRKSLSIYLNDFPSLTFSVSMFFSQQVAATSLVVGIRVAAAAVAIKPAKRSSIAHRLTQDPLPQHPPHLTSQLCSSPFYRHLMFPISAITHRPSPIFPLIYCSR